MFGAILVGRRNDLKESDQSMAADMPHGQRTSPQEGGRLNALFSAYLRWRFSDRRTSAFGRRGPRRRLGRAFVQRQDIGNGAAGVLLGQSIISFRQQARIERLAKLGYPSRVKIVKDAVVNPTPIMYRHGL